MRVQAGRPSAAPLTSNRGLPLAAAGPSATDHVRTSRLTRCQRRPGAGGKVRCAAAPAAAAAVAAPAALATFFPVTAWAAWTAAGLVAYLAYWVGLNVTMPHGRPVADFSVKSAPPAIRLLVRGVMFGALACFFLLPWAAMAASSSWRAGLTYFLPPMALTAANIVVEQRTWRAGKPLAVYASTPVNNLVRLIVSAAGLWDMSLLAAVRGAAVHWSLPLTAGAQGLFSLAVMLSVIPAVISQLPVRSGEAEL